MCRSTPAAVSRHTRRAVGVGSRRSRVGRARQSRNRTWTPRHEVRCTGTASDHPGIHSVCLVLVSNGVRGITDACTTLWLRYRTGGPVGGRWAGTHSFRPYGGFANDLPIPASGLTGLFLFRENRQPAGLPLGSAHGARSVYGWFLDGFRETEKRVERRI